jgi:hypothetical protein
MPTKESIYVAGQNLGNLLAGVGAKLKEDRRQSIKESIDLKYSKGKALFYDEAGKERSSVDIQNDLLQGINAYTSLGFKDEASALKDYYGTQKKEMDLNRSNEYWKNVVTMNNKSITLPEGSPPANFDLSEKVPLDEKGVKSFTQIPAYRNGKVGTELRTFDPSAPQGKEWFTEFVPGYNVGIPSTYGQEYKSGTKPEPEKPVWKQQQLINKETGKPEMVVWDNNTMTGKDGKPIDFSKYREETTEEKKGEQVQKKNPPDNVDIANKFISTNKGRIESIFGSRQADAVQQFEAYLNGSNTDIQKFKDRFNYDTDPAVKQFIDEIVNLRENKYNSRQDFIEKHFK